MKRVASPSVGRAGWLAVLLAAALVVPTAAAAPAPQPYPRELVALLPGWVAAAEKAGANDTERAWYHEPLLYLQKAKDAAAQGRVRTTIFDLESYHELRVTGEVIDLANASAATPGEQKAFILSKMRLARSDANASWAAFRSELHLEDGNLHSLRAAEIAIYAADIGLVSKLEGESFEGLLDQFVATAGIDRGYVLALAHGAQTVTLDLGYAHDILATAGAHEGLPPQIVDANWTALARAVTAVNTAPASTAKELESLAAPARANGEVLMGAAFTLAELRAQRSSSIQQIYGDAKGRVGTVLSDLSRNMGKQLANTTLVLPESYGLLGVFTADATDRASLAQTFVEEGQGDMGGLITSWAALDGATNAVRVLGALSPLHPTPTPAPSTPAKVPDVALPLVALSIVALALLARRK